MSTVSPCRRTASSTQDGHNQTILLAFAIRYIFGSNVAMPPHKMRQWSRDARSKRTLALGWDRELNSPDNADNIIICLSRRGPSKFEQCPNPHNTRCHLHGESWRHHTYITVTVVNSRPTFSWVQRERERERERDAESTICNRLMSEQIGYIIYDLQRIQNALARCVLDSKAHRSSKIAGTSTTLAAYPLSYRL